MVNFPADGAVGIPGACVVVLSGEAVRQAATALEQHVARLRGGPNGGGGVTPFTAELLEVLRSARMNGCATQPTQPSLVRDGPPFPQEDEMTVKEAAELMGRTQANVRKRVTKRRTLEGFQFGGPGGPIRVSKRAVLADIAKRNRKANR